MMRRSQHPRRSRQRACCHCLLRLRISSRLVFVVLTATNSQRGGEASKERASERAQAKKQREVSQTYPTRQVTLTAVKRRSQTIEHTREIITPEQSSGLGCMVDSNASTVVIPSWVARTFPHQHIKIVSKNEEGEYTHLDATPFPRQGCRSQRPITF